MSALLQKRRLPGSRFFRRALLAMALLPALLATAQAQCTVTAQGDAAGIGLAQSLAANSDSPVVRAAYGAHRCNIRKLEHGGGRPCQPGMPRDHVTIRVFGTATFHVFPVRLHDGRFCTTE
jgi:hypothetical protein